MRHTAAILVVFHGNHSRSAGWSPAIHGLRLEDVSNEDGTKWPGVQRLGIKVYE